MREHERVARFQVRRNVFLVHLGLNRVRQHHHDHVGFGGGIGIGHHLQSGGLGLGPTLAAVVEPDAHVHAAVLQVQRMGVALAAVTDDGDLLPFKKAQIRLIFVIDSCHDVLQPFVATLSVLVYV